jgi:preprotein translocase subunit SecG
MEHVVLVIHLIVTLVMIILILLQRSEGGGLGLGTGGGGLGNFASVQSTANALTKITTYVAMIFFVTSIILAIIAARGNESSSILDAASKDVPVATAPAAPAAVDAAKPKETEPPTVPIAK